MTGRRYDWTDPREWLNRARSSLRHAKAADESVYLEDLCYDPQQAAEKAIKGVLLHKRIPFPYIHDLDRLLQLVPNTGEALPEAVSQAGDLTRYAAVRYPRVFSQVTEQEYQQALSVAEEVVLWAERIILGKGP